MFGFALCADAGQRGLLGFENTGSTVPYCLQKQGNRSKAKRWQDEELRLLYSQYHKSGFDGRQVG